MVDCRYSMDRYARHKEGGTVQESEGRYVPQRVGRLAFNKKRAVAAMLSNGAPLTSKYVPQER